MKEKQDNLFFFVGCDSISHDIVNFIDRECIEKREKTRKNVIGKTGRKRNGEFEEIMQ